MRGFVIWMWDHRIEFMAHFDVVGQAFTFLF